MKNILLVLLIATPLLLIGQKKDKNDDASTPPQKASNNSAYELQKNIALKALQYNDLMVAKNALYQMMALEPTNTDLIDSLAILYFQMGSYTECVLVCRDILEESPDKLAILELKAASEQSLGLAKMALDDYESLYPKTGKIFHLYQIAGLQYDLKRFGECDLTLQRLLQDEKLKESKIQIYVQQGRPQEVAMEAGVYNIQAMILLNLNKEGEARAKFKKALEISPEFVLPKNNLAALDNKGKEK